MLIFGKNAMFASFLLVMSTTLLANDKTLLVNGVYAAVHGDLAVDKGEWRNKESFSALRMKAGFQLIRIGFVGLTVGYQKVGFYTAERNWTKGEANKVNFDYRGPVAELHLFPDALFNFSLAAHKGEGFSFQSGDAESFGLDCAGDSFCTSARIERSRLDISELTGQVNYLFRPGLALFLGAGSRQVKGTPFYETNRSTTVGGETTTPTKFERFGASSWKIDSQFFLLGIRGTNL